MTTRLAMRRRGRSWQVLATAVVLGGAMAAGELSAGFSPVEAAVSWAIIVAYALFVTLLQGRSDTMATLSGRPVDERWQLIHQRALATTGEIGTGVAVLGYLIAQFRHADAQPFALVAAAMGITYLSAIVIYRSRI